MSKVSITKSKLDTLANTISAKSGVAAPLTLDQMNATAQTMLKPTGTKLIIENGEGIDVAAYATVDVDVSGSATLITKSITANGTYNAQDDDADGYSSVTVSVSGGTPRTSTDLTVSGATVTAPAGVYAEAASKSVASGTAGTPTATKGSVSNHSVSVTPSVTNTTGYITGDTKTGTAVTVSASELVSGTYNVTSSGTKDVSNYASALVPAGTVTAPSSISGTSATVSTGTNTLTLSKTVSVTPTVSAAGFVAQGAAGNSSVSLTANVTTKAAATYYPSTSDQSVSASQYLTGAQTIKAVTHNLDASKILSGTTFVIGDTADSDRVASVSGTAVFQTVYSGSSAPSSSTGVNGDIYIRTA